MPWYECYTEGNCKGLMDKDMVIKFLHVKKMVVGWERFPKRSYLNKSLNNERGCGKWKETRSFLVKLLKQTFEKDEKQNCAFGAWLASQHCFNKRSMRIGSRLKKRDQQIGWHHLVEVLKCYGNDFRYCQISQILNWSTSHVSNLCYGKYPKMNKLGGPLRG